MLPVTSNRWDVCFMDIARRFAAMSKDPKRKVAALVVSKDKRKVGWGFNGFPAGIEDTIGRLTDVELKNELMVHAEANAVINSGGANGWAHTMYVTQFPCSRCAGEIIQAGIKRVVVAEGPAKSGKWQASHALALTMFLETKVDVVGIASSFKCIPVQYGDTTICSACGLTWDTNDTDPPICSHRPKMPEY